jgi:hypothetical protein
MWVGWVGILGVVVVAFLNLFVYPQNAIKLIAFCGYI